MPMPMPGEQAETKVEKSFIENAKLWGESPIPPMALATLITAQNLRPLQPLPMLFPPVLLFSSYLNVNGYTVDSAGVTGSWSLLYMVMAGRRKQPFARKLGTRGLIRGATMGLCVANAVCGLLAYGFGKRRKEEQRRERGI